MKIVRIIVIGFVLLFVGARVVDYLGSGSTYKICDSLPVGAQFSAEHFAKMVNSIKPKVAFLKAGRDIEINLVGSQVDLEQIQTIDRQGLAGNAGVTSRVPGWFGRYTCKIRFDSGKIVEQEAYTRN
jgi:hypothetical protein